VAIAHRFTIKKHTSNLYPHTCTYLESLLKFNELGVQDGGPANTAHVTYVCWDQTTVTSSTKMNGRQVRPTSIR